MIKKILKVIGIIFMIIFIVFASWGFSSMLSSGYSFREYCAKNYSGLVSSGYCVYQINGTSHSFPEDSNWIRNHTDLFGGLK